MADIVYVKDLKTGKTEPYTPANARDLTTHRPDQFVIAKAVDADIPTATEKANDAYDLGIVADRNGRVGPRTQHNLTETLAPQDIVDEVKENGEGGNADGEDNDDDDDDDDANLLAGLGNGIARSSSGELVDDELVGKLKGLNKQQLIAFGKTEYNLDIDGRTKEDNVRLAIYDAAEAKNKG